MRNDNDLGEILDALDIEDYLDAHGVDYIRTRGRSGPQLNIKVCPVCGNDGRKVYINSETGLGTCFGGSHPPDQTFNKWRLVAALNPELAGRQVVQHLEAFVSARAWRPKRKSVAVTAPPALILPESYPLPLADGRNIKYLSNRGISNAITQYFHLRYCHEGTFPYQMDGQWKHQRYHGRVIIPVFDLDGKLVTFQGRDVTGTAERRYLFPPGLAATGSLLLNGMNVKDTDSIVVGEGAFDVMAIKSAFDDVPSLRHVTAIGTFGKELSYGPGDTQEQKLLALKARGVQNITFMWDGEVKATEAAVRAGLRCLALGFKVRVALLPKERDPNEVTPAEVVDAYFKALPLTTKLDAVRIVLRRREINQ